MSKINQLQNAIRALSAGTFQKLMDVYLYKRFGFCNITPLGSHTGSDKTTKGTPDSYVRADDGKFILIAYGSVSENPSDKIEKDILACLDQKKTGIDIDDIKQVICCHTSTNITAGQSKQLCSHFDNTMLIGLGELANDLYLKYPSLAKDYLSIELDTHQIFDVTEYIHYASKNEYATSLNMPLLCREKELDELKARLQETPVLLICGKSGSGKTRFALELVTAYGSEQKTIIKVIKSNNESIYEDLKMTFADGEDYLVLIDDADQLVQLGHLLDMSNSRDRKHTIKLVLTVRDYAKEKLIRKVKDVCIPQIYTLDSLSDDSIAQVLEENLGIKNTECLKRVQKIAKGNVRLAIMAGTCAVKGNWSAIQNAFDILDYYYSEIIECMDQKEIIIATLIAFFDSFLLHEEKLPFVIAAELGINASDFIEKSRTLHEKEIVSIFDNLAVKFEEQNLRDFLLYYVFFKKKWLRPSYMIEKAFPRYKEKVVFAFNTLVGLFSSEENSSYLEVEIKKAWSYIKGQAENLSFQFVESFHTAIPDETLMMVKQKIESLPEKKIDFSVFDFEKDSNYHFIHSELIKILIAFKYSDQFEDALQLLIYHLERNTENPMDFFFAFGKNLGFDQYSHHFEYERERNLVDKLLRYYSNKGTTEAARCLAFCVSNLLKFDFSAAESNGNKTISICQFGLASCEKVFDIRELCIKALSELFDNPKHRQYAIQSLLNFPGFTNYNSDETILMHDIKVFTYYFSDRLMSSNFSDCAILHHFHKICIRYNLPEPTPVSVYQNNRIFMLYLTLKKDRSFHYEDWETAEAERKKGIEQVCCTVANQEFEQLWDALSHSSISQDSHNNWDIATGIDIVFSSLACEPESFMPVLESYIAYGTPYGNYIHSIILGLLNILGYRESVAYIEAKEFKSKSFWLSLIYNHISEEEIDEYACEYFVVKLKEQENELVKYALSLDVVTKINTICPGFIVRYVSILNTECKTCPNTIAEFLSGIDLKNEVQIEAFLRYFESDIGVLEEAYLNALHGRRYFDFEGKLFIQVIRKDIEFLKMVVRDKIVSGNYHDDNTLFAVLWDQADYYELITGVLETLREGQQYWYYNHIWEQLFMYEQGEMERWKKQDEWFETYIAAKSADMEAMGFIFAIVCDLSDEQRKKAILYFCSQNKSFSDFQRIPISRRHMSWSGSEVPLLEGQIACYEHLKNDLQGFAFIEHRAYIDQEIQRVQRNKEQVLLAEFIQDR